MQMMLDLGSTARMPSQYEHYTLFFRNLAYQQFLYQHSFSLNSLARQKILFGSLDQGHLFNTQFHRITGLPVIRFISLALMLLTRFVDRKNAVISQSWFEPVLRQYPQQEIDKFLNNLAVPYSDLGATLNRYDKGERRSYEYYEQTPFQRFPLVRINENYLCVYPNVLYRALEHFVYDALRDWDASRFMQRFGPVFERYVESVLSYAGANYVVEAELEKELPGTGGVIDFLITEDDANIFVDAKAVEMAYQGKVAYASEVVKDKTKVSVLKAIEQAHEVNNRLRGLASGNPVIRARKRNYLIVVTYKELYLGNGKTFYEAVAGSKIDEIYSRYASDVRIPLENMYFLTIEELDLFAESIKQRKVGLVEGLEKAKQGDERPETRKFDFTLHLREWGANGAPCYLEKTYETMFKEIENLLKKAEGS